MEVICIFSCDKWKSAESMRLICVSTVEKLDEIMAKIKDEYEYTDEDMETYIYTEAFTVDEY